MGRLPSLRAAGRSAALVAALAGVRCDLDRGKSVAPAVGERSERVPAVETGVAPARASASAMPVKPQRSRKLCEASRLARDLPRAQPSRVTAPSEAQLGGLASGAGRWTWINLFAAWCEPCKAEIPRLRALSAKASAAGHPVDVAFISVDDDERQLETFLAAQPSGGVRAAYWLREGKPRRDWLTEVGVDPDPQLPVQILVDPRGKIRCIEAGAVEDDDYTELLSLLSR